MKKSTNQASSYKTSFCSTAVFKNGASVSDYFAFTIGKYTNERTKSLKISTVSSWSRQLAILNTPIFSSVLLCSPFALFWECHNWSAAPISACLRRGPRGYFLTELTFYQKLYITQKILFIKLVRGHCSWSGVFHL